MRLLSLFVCVCLSLSVASAQTGSVSLRNVSFPFTSLEVGNTVEVRITGAAPFGTVTVVQNGQPPYVFGTTNAFGDWSVQAVETQEYVGSYHQVWYVNGVEVPPANADSTYLPYAPRLPSFNVYSNSLPSGTPPVLASNQFNSCGRPQATAFWRWTPVGYYSSTAFGNSAVATAISRWNSAQNKVPMQYSSSALDIWVYDGSLPAGTYGATSLYTQGCSPCYGYRNECNGTCMNSSALYYSDIILNAAAINAFSAAAGASAQNVASYIVTHELGHALQLDHSQPLIKNGRCSEVGSVMYESVNPAFFCGVISPTSRDVTAINSAYPSSPPYCPLGQNYCAGNTCP